ncbi:sulfotransferase [Thioclava sp. BHET1]|nr:sulfotransferase [Thioclava sp. BHET1]
MTGQATVLLGVGATKAGTTWLYRYLSGRDDCHFRSVKELHFFDALDHGSQQRQIDQLSRRSAGFSAALAGRNSADAALHVRLADHQEMIAVHEASRAEAATGIARYRDYLLRDAGTARLVGDITPAYSLLSEARLADMARLTPMVRMVYLMRDPVERLWSQIRMHVVRSGAAAEDMAAKAAHVLGRITRKDALPDLTARGDYAGALEKLRRAVPAGQLLVEFSERLFSEEGVRRLCGFLGLGFRPAATESRVHEGVRLAMTEDQRRAAAAYLAPQYDYVNRTFGPLPERWQASLARV